MHSAAHSQAGHPYSRTAGQGQGDGARSGRSLYQARFSGLSQPVVVAWIIASGMIVGLTIGIAWKLGPKTLLFGIPVCMICVGVATVIVAWHTRFMGVEVDPRGVAWRVRFGRDFFVHWNEVDRIVLLTQGGRKAGFQLETKSGSFVIAPGEFQHSSKLASALSLQAAVLGAAFITREQPRETP